MTSRAASSPPARAAVVAVVGVGAPVALCAALVPLRDDIRPANASILLVLVVPVAALTGGRPGAAAAALVGAASFDFFLTRPYYSFQIDARGDIETTVLLLVVGLVIGEIVTRSRRAQRLALEQGGELRRIRHHAELAAGSDSP